METGKQQGRHSGTDAPPGNASGNAAVEPGEPDSFLDFQIELKQVKKTRKEKLLKVEMPAHLLDELESYALRDSDREVGAILLGRFLETEKGLKVKIDAWIEARFAVSSRAQLKFTHETWEYVAAEHERCHPDLQVVGWFHTHPGFGVFLSAYDLFIHRHFFRAPGQVALVCDPLRHETGLFCRQDGEIVSGEYTLTGIRERGKIKKTTTVAKSGSIKENKVIRTVTGDAPSLLLDLLLLTLLCLVLGLLLFILFSGGLKQRPSGDEQPGLPAQFIPGVHLVMDDKYKERM